jgi:hypothetical protein
MTKPSFALSAASRFMIQKLETVEIGQTVTYEELSAAAGEPVSGGNPALQTAIRRLRRDKDMVFAVIRKIGVKLLRDTETVDYASSYQSRVRHIARKSFEIGSKVDFATLPQQYQMKQSANASIMATLAQMTSSAKVMEIEKKMPEGKRELPINDTLKMFMK